MISLLYCPACKVAVSTSITAVCVVCSGDVVDLTPFTRDAEKRAFDKVRVWAIEQRDMCQRMKANEANDREWFAWNGSEVSLNALITWLDNGMDSEANK